MACSRRRATGLVPAPGLASCAGAVPADALRFRPAATRRSRDAQHMRHVEAAVVGAGYFGCRAALHLRGLGFSRVLLLDREDAIMRRASFVNQARVHNGYHYPRSLGTAISSRNN